MHSISRVDGIRASVARDPLEASLRTSQYSCVTFIRVNCHAAQESSAGAHQTVANVLLAAVSSRRASDRQLAALWLSGSPR